MAAPTTTVGVPLLQSQNLGPQSNGFGITTGAPPNKPDFASYFGKPLREIKTNPYEGCAHNRFVTGRRERASLFEATCMHIYERQASARIRLA
jgi:hypothetical protein